MQPFSHLSFTPFCPQCSASWLDNANLPFPRSRPSKNRASRIMRVLIVVLFALSTLSISVDVYRTFSRIQHRMLDPTTNVGITTSTLALSHLSYLNHWNTYLTVRAFRSFQVARLTPSKVSSWRCSGSMAYMGCVAKHGYAQGGLHPYSPMDCGCW